MDIIVLPAVVTAGLVTSVAVLAARDRRQRRREFPHALLAALTEDPDREAVPQ